MLSLDVGARSLTLVNCFGGTSSSACAALGASFGIDVVDIAFGDSANGAFVNTRTASNAVVTNYISHFNSVLIRVSMKFVRAKVEFFAELGPPFRFKIR